MTSTHEIRRSFLDYFVKAGHEELGSAPLVPYNDPTLMFVNAGMVPFKNVFTGHETPQSARATSAQKCVRAGGKHNDLDNVGYTARHHTFFEMLGNFSFGDYFKEEAIHHAWTLLTREWELPADRLIATVYHTDEAAFDLWRKISGLPEERILKIATSDNFWSMGDTGPCGPCSEIFYDHGDHIAGGPPGSADEDGDRFVEIWNLVFMQFDRGEQGEEQPLPKPSIDTGMGLERIAAVMQGQHNNYDIDLFQALTAASQNVTGPARTQGEIASHRVIADHLRSSAFLMADEVLPSNEGRGYVLRRIMRRAMRHAHLLSADEPFMHRLVASLVSEMGQAYPELVRAQPLIEEVLQREESQFRKTLDKGLRLLDDAVADLGAGEELDGETAFRLYDTYGFPYDLTEDALRSRGFGVNRAQFDRAMDAQKAQARAAWKGSGETASEAVWFNIAEKHGASEFTGYTATSGEGQVVALVRDGAQVESASAGDEVVILTNQTPFYGESGGQTGDAGSILSQAGMRAEVHDTSKPLGRLHAHRAQITSGKITPGENVQLEVDEERRTRIRANHSATHLVHAALRASLGDHVTQKGSLVSDDRLRFDFSHPSPLTPDQIAAIEASVNAEIRANEEVSTRLMSPDDAVEAGALALFGEKYGAEVRVLAMGRTGAAGRAYSVELCGGTHVRATGDIGLFVIVHESSVSAGVRRIEALTGEAARLWLMQKYQTLIAVEEVLGPSSDPVQRAHQLKADLKLRDKEVEKAKRAVALAGSGAASAEDIVFVGETKLIARTLPDYNPKELRTAIDDAKREHASAVVALVAVNEGKAAFAVGVTDDLVERYNAVDLVRAGVAALGGKGGGGRPDMAQGGGPDGSKAQDAIAAVRAALA